MSLELKPGLQPTQLPNSSTFIAVPPVGIKQLMDVSTLREPYAGCFPEFSGLDFANSQVYGFASRDEWQGQREYAAFIKHPLKGESFSNFLAVVSPIRHPRYSPEEHPRIVLADWNPIWRADTEVFADLRRGHQKTLGSDWEDFMKELPHFKASLENYAGYILEQIIPEHEDALKAILDGSIESSEIFDKLGISISLIANVNSIVISYRNKLVFTADLTRDKYEGLNYHKMHTLGEGLSLLPTMRWHSNINNNPGRTWQLDYLDDPLLIEQGKKLLADDKPIHNNDPQPRLNPLAGLLAVAYLSPNLRQNWAKTQQDRQMHAAQIPIVALQNREQLANSEFVNSVEQYIQQSI